MAAPFELERARSAGEIVVDALRLWSAHPAVFLAIGGVIAVPVELVIPGILGGRLLAAYDADAPVSAGAPGATNIVFSLWVTPAIWAATAVVLLGLARGSIPRLREVLAQALERAADSVIPVLLASLGAFLGLLLLVAPGIYLYVRWYLIVQTVVFDGARGLGALRRSSEIVAGQWWRAFGRTILIAVVCAAPLLGLIVLGQIAGAATGFEAAALAGEAVGDVLFFPLLGIMATLLYFDLRARKGGAPGARS